MNIELNQWESEFFARPIYQAIPRNVAETPRWTAEMPTGLVQAKVPAGDLARLAFLQQHHFQLVETAVDFRLDLANFSLDRTACESQLHCRLAAMQDLPELKGWIGKAFSESRFRPPYFTDAENQRFYQHWIENAATGQFDDFCLLLEKNGKQQGAVSVRLDGVQANIGLLAVEPHCRGRGIGNALINCAVGAIQQYQNPNKPCETLLITTQLSNLPAMKLYQSVGAKIIQSYYWLYY